MAAPKGLKSLLNQVNKHDGKAMGLAIEGEHYVKRRKGETQEEFEKRKRALEEKAARARARALEAMKKMR